MDKIKDGGSAFPRTFDGQGNGMSLRDWFAGQAMIGLIQAEHNNLREHVSRMSYVYADAMLTEREKRNG